MNAAAEAASDPNVQAAFITSGFALVGTLAALIVPRLRRQSRQLRDAKDQLAIVVEHVANTHSTNLREDIDGLAHRLDVLLDGMGAMRLDVSWLRREQLDQAHRLTLLEDA